MIKKKYINKSKIEIDLGQLFEKYKNQLYLFSLRLSGDSDFAKDIVQDSFLKIFKYLDKGGIVKNPRSLLFKTAYNIFVDKNRKALIVKENLFNLFITESEKSDPGNNYIRDEEGDIIIREISKLKEREKAIICLYAENFSYDDMSAILKIRRSSVGKVLSRSIDKLRKKIKDGG